MSLQKPKPVRAASDNILQQVEKFKYLGVVFMRDRRRNREIDTRVGKANAVPREFYRSVVTKRELSNTAKPSVFKSVFAPSLTYDHESWIINERKNTISSSRRRRWDFLRRVDDMTLRDKVHRCEIRESLNVEPHFLLTGRFQLR